MLVDSVVRKMGHLMVPPVLHVKLPFFHAI